MEISRTIVDVRSRLAAFRTGQGGAVALVPTMGFFHEGHLSLMRAARSRCDMVVVSIFVNPTQFGPAEDLDEYPRDLDSDLQMAAAEAVDLVFAPNAEEMYPPGHETSIDVGSVAEGLCGRSRPGHFQGVATVVAKLFNIVGPDEACFGQKDAQQVAVIKQMVRDLDFDVKIMVCPTVREADGLALSSRNSYLSAEERDQAVALYHALEQAREQVQAGETSASRIRRHMRRSVGANYLVDLEYARIVDAETMHPVEEIKGEALALVAARVGSIRLIDNMLLDVDAQREKESECGE